MKLWLTFVPMKKFKSILVLIFVLNSFSAFSQKNKLKNDSLAIRDSIREYMFHGVLLSMDAMQAKYESQKSVDLSEKQQKAGEAQNLFFQSRAYYRKAIAYDKNYYPAWSNMGTAYFLQDLPKAAIPCFRKAILINGNYASAWFNLGKAYTMINMNDSAVYSYKQCIRLDSTSIQAYQELSRLIILHQKDSSAALRLLRLSSYHKPTSEVPWVSMSVIYFSYNDSVNGIASLEKAAQIYAGDVQRLQKLANYFQYHNDQKKAAYYLNILAIENKKQEVPIDANPD